MSDKNVDEQLDEIMLMIDRLDCGDPKHYKKQGDIRAKLNTLTEQRVAEARIEIASWAVHYTDKIENENPAPDDMWRTFKFIRNGLREEFEAVYGVDPTPNYDPKLQTLRDKANND